MLAIALALAALPAAAPSDPSFECRALPGAKALLARPTLHWLLLGEAGHGTNELPRAATDLVCAAIAARGTFVVALEHAAANQPMLDAYLASDGGAVARAALLAGPAWRPSWADGKSSRAMLKLIEWLRVRHQRGEVLRVVAFDPDMVLNGTDREQQMSARLRAIAPSNGSIVTALTGSFHARRRLLIRRRHPIRPWRRCCPRNRHSVFAFRAAAVATGHAPIRGVASTTPTRPAAKPGHST